MKTPPNNQKAPVRIRKKSSSKAIVTDGAIGIRPTKLTAESIRKLAVIMKGKNLVAALLESRANTA